jgi:hypothetical protein
LISFWTFSRPLSRAPWARDWSCRSRVVCTDRFWVVRSFGS